MFPKYASRASMAGLALGSLSMFVVFLGSSQAVAESIDETEELRNKILVKSGLQFVSPSAIRGLSEVWALAKQIKWAAEVLCGEAPGGGACWAFDPPQEDFFDLPVTVETPPAAPPFTEADVRAAFDPDETGLGVVTPALIDALNVSEAANHVGSANYIAFFKAVVRANAACAAEDQDAFEARALEAETFGGVARTKFLEAAAADALVAAELPGSDLPDPVVTFAQQQQFIILVVANGLPDPEPDMLSQLGLTASEIQQVTDLVVNGIPGGDFEDQEFSFGTSLAGNDDTCGDPDAEICGGETFNLHLVEKIDEELAGLTCVPCPWDCANGDGVVSTADLLALLSDWGEAGSPCDFDGGVVSTADLLKLLSSWGPCP